MESKALGINTEAITNYIALLESKVAINSSTAFDNNIKWRGWHDCKFRAFTNVGFRLECIASLKQAGKGIIEIEWKNEYILHYGDMASAQKSVERAWATNSKPL